MPHMHLSGKDMEVELRIPTGESETTLNFTRVIKSGGGKTANR